MASKRLMPEWSPSEQDYRPWSFLVEPDPWDYALPPPVDEDGDLYVPLEVYDQAMGLEAVLEGTD